MKQIFKPFFKADKFARESRCCDVQLNDKQVGLPAYQALEGCDGVRAQCFNGQKELISDIDMNKSKGHGVTADNPTSVRNKIFIACGGIGPKSDKKPRNGHQGKSNWANTSGVIVKSKGQNGNGAQEAAYHVDSSQRSVGFGFVFKKGSIEQNRAQNNRWHGSENMSY